MKDKLYLPSRADMNTVLELTDKKLPSFPQVAAKLLEAFQKDTASLEELSKIVETDPGLSVKILQAVNSALYGLGRRISSLSEAMIFLGLDEIKKLAIEVTVFDQLFKSGQYREFDRLLFWRHCLSVAVLSSLIARETNYPDPEEAYIAGLLHDVGKVFLDLRGRKNYGEFIVTLSMSTDQVIEEERRVMGLGHDDVGAYLCALWRLPEKLIQVVKYHHQSYGHLGLGVKDKHLIAIVSLANFLCWTQGIGSFDFIRPPVLPPEVGESIDPETFGTAECITRMNREIEKISEFYKFIFPSPEQLRENILTANLKLSRANTRYYYQEDPLAGLKGTAADKPSADMDLELGKPLSRAKSIREVLDIVMYQIGRIFQPRNWSILLKDQKTSDMVFSVVVGVNKEKLQGAKLSEGEGVAGYIMTTGEPLVIKDVAKDSRFSSRVDQYTGFKTKSIVGTPLKTEKKVFGVIELVNRINDDPFMEKDLKLLSDIAEYAAIAIERSYYHQALTTLATKDASTGLKNRWSFERAVSNKNDVLKNYGSIFSILIVDIQGLRQIAATDASKSDTVLKKMARVMTETKRREDDLYRYGENTFVMILPQTYSEGSRIARNRLSTNLSIAVADMADIPVKTRIFSHTIGAEDCGQLKQTIGESLSRSVALAEETAVSDFEYSLQDLIEKEGRTQAADNDAVNVFGKTVSLSGRFVRLKTGEAGHMRVERVSLAAVGFRISRSHRIRVNDFLDIHFTLDNLNKDLVERRAVVREIKGNYVSADFYNPPPYAKNLGFYLMS